MLIQELLRVILLICNIPEWVSQHQACSPQILCPLPFQPRCILISRKKHKVSGAFWDQSIEQLNDITAVSGVSLREEEEQLLPGPKDDSRVSEASRRVVQEEEERLILEKIPLQKKLAEIVAKCGLKSLSNDVERCLSLCTKDRMHGLIINLIRLSKQRFDIEKRRHQTVITSDIQQQLIIMNLKAQEKWEKKQVEAEKLQSLNEANKKEDDMMRTTAANFAARAAAGGDDMLAKWQLMAEQAQQKCGLIHAASDSQPGTGVSRKPLLTSVWTAMENNEEKGGDHSAPSTSGAVEKNGRSRGVPQTRVARTISVQDVICVLERDPLALKSALLYQLYEKNAR